MRDRPRDLTLCSYLLCFLLPWVILSVVQFVLRSVCYHCMYSFLPWLTKNTLNITFPRVVLSANLDRPRDLTLCSFLCTSLFYVQLNLLSFFSSENVCWKCVLIIKNYNFLQKVFNFHLLKMYKKISHSWQFKLAFLFSEFRKKSSNISDKILKLEHCNNGYWS